MVQAEVESVAIGFLHGYANPQHERRVEEIIGEILPDLSITLSAEVCPEIREFERLTTAANAYVRPVMSHYLDSLKFLGDRIAVPRVADDFRRGL